MSSTITALTSGGGLAMAGDTSGQLELKTNNGTTAITIDASQNVGIGTSSSVNGLSVYKYGTQWTGNTTNLYPVPAGNVFIQTPAISGADNWIGMTGSYGTSTGSANLLLQTNLNNTSQQAGNYIGSEATSSSSAALTFGRMIGGASVGVNATKSEAMRIDSSANLLINATTTIANEKLNVTNPVASGAFGTYIKYSGSAPNGNSNEFLYCSDTSTVRAYIKSNGGIGNYSANNTNLSDERTKKDITEAGNYLDKICAIPVRTFLYKDQTDNELNLGVVAQEVEAVAPELVDNSGFGGEKKGEIPLKAIYQTDLQYALMKCIQELNAKVTSLEEQILNLGVK